MEASLSCERARKVCIVKTLAKLGHFPTRKSEKEAWFLSPLRSETQASFSVSLIKNLWYDFGTGKGGSAIDLIMELNNCTAYEAVQCLQENILFSFSSEKLSDRRESVQIKNVNELKHPALVQLLNSRKIPLKIGQTFCKEVWYSLNSKIYFSIGLINDSGGWELRNKYHKCSTAPKNISSFGRGWSRLLIVEGIFDFLSLKVLDNKLFSTSEIIALNSLSNIGHVSKELNSYPEI